jgi:hypothetical protein
MTTEAETYRNQKGRFTGENPWTKYFTGSPYQTSKRFCKYGHPYFGDNLRTARRVRVNPKTGKSYVFMERVCLACAAERGLRYRMKKKQLAGHSKP